MPELKRERTRGPLGGQIHLLARPSFLHWTGVGGRRHPPLSAWQGGAWEAGTLYDLSLSEWRANMLCHPRSFDKSPRPLGF